MHPECLTLHTRHVAASFDKQLHLADLVGKLDWRFGLNTGLLSFGDRFQWQAHLLGTEAHDSQTWLWAWANQASNIPPQLHGDALTLRLLGEHHQTPELAEPQLPLGKVNGHFFALLASGICEANAYFRAPYDGGAAFLLIKDHAFPKNTDSPLNRIVTVFPQAITAIEIEDHKLALAGYLAYYGLDGQAEGDALIVREGDEAILTATFDGQRRLTKLDATIKAGKP